MTQAVKRERENAFYRRVKIVSVLLVNSPQSFLEVHRVGEKRKSGEFLAYPPLGILYLASVLEKEGIEVNIIDCPARGSGTKEVAHAIEKEKPSIVGISATTPQTRTTVQLAKTLKKNFGRGMVIGLGGAHVTADPDFINRFPYFDFALTGEGEITFTRIVKEILKGKKIKGIYHGKAPANLDDIPFPARHLIDNDLYFMPIHGKKFTSILGSRGCPYNCLYCSRPVIGRNVRYRSPRNVIDEMEECIREYGIEWFQFVDDTMTLNRNHTIQFCEEVIDRKLEVEWGCQTRVDLVDENLLMTMYTSGCREISFGVESGNERIRKILRKSFSTETVFKAFKLCRKIGIETVAFFMLGLPTETTKELFQTVNFGKKIDASYIAVHVTTPFPGSDLFTLAINEESIPIDIWDKYTRNEFGNNLPTYVPNTLTRKSLLEAQKQAYRNFYFRPQYILRRLFLDTHSMKKLKQDLRTALILMRL